LGSHISFVRFCAQCGGELHSERLKENEPERAVCAQCGAVSYLDPKVVACCLVTRDEKVLLLRRAIEPERSKWVLPGGYVDRGETVVDAALRELWEECALKATIDGILGVYSYAGDAHVVIVYKALAREGDPSAGDETEDVRWFTADEIPWPDLAFRSTTDALKDYLNGLEGE
jgi:ADP-ribose pyrophosphatase YjhB (NUDIX family)